MSDPLRHPTSPAGSDGPPARPPVLWPAKPSSGRGRKHGTSTSVPFDRWFRYPAGFATDYADLLMAQLRLEPGSTVVDPFAGSGVVGTATRHRRLGFFGIEAHPMVAELAALKLQTPTDPGRLIAAGHRVAEQAGSRTARSESVPALIERSFSAGTLQVLLSLRDAVRLEVQAPWSTYLKWALLATLRDVAEVKVGWPYQRPAVPRRPRHQDVLRRFLQRVRWMADDVAAVPNDGLNRHVVVGDARQVGSWNAVAAAGGVQGSVSSPPYLNNFDYADATRLEAYFWGEASTWAELVTVIRADMLSASTQQVMKSRSESAVERLEQTPVSDHLRPLMQALHRERRARPRGKYYDRLLPEYFDAMHEILCNLARATRPGAPVAWLIGDSAPYGVHVDTPALIGALSEGVGFSVESDVTLRFRGQRWTSTRTRHQERLTERLLVLRRV